VNNRDVLRCVEMFDCTVAVSEIKRYREDQGDQVRECCSYESGGKG
jgi:hypothetical protein